VFLRTQLKNEKEGRLQAEKTILALSNQLTNYGSVENVLNNNNNNNNNTHIFCMKQITEY